MRRCISYLFMYGAKETCVLPPLNVKFECEIDALPMGKVRSGAGTRTSRPSSGRTGRCSASGGQAGCGKRQTGGTCRRTRPLAAPPLCCCAMGVRVVCCAIEDTPTAWAWPPRSRGGAAWQVVKNTKSRKDLHRQQRLMVHCSIRYTVQRLDATVLGEDPFLYER